MARGSSRESGETRAAGSLRLVLRRVRCCEVFLPTQAKIKAAQPACGVFLRSAFVSLRACFRQNMKIHENADLRQQAHADLLGPSARLRRSQVLAVLLL